MAKALLIAEKPSLMRTIKDVYSKHRSEFADEIDFMAQAGHLLTLKLPKEIDAEKYKWKLENFPEEYPFEYKIGEGKNKLVKDIKDAIKSDGYSYIIHAGDPDQEGEILIRETLEYAKNKLPVKRFWTNDLCEGAVLGALKHLIDDADYDSLYNAALLRQHADYQFGMNVSGTVSCVAGDICKLGRVKAPIVSMIAARELEIRNYVEKKSYKPAFKYKDVVFEKDEVFDTPEMALKNVPNTEYAQVVSTKYEKKQSKAPKLFKLSTLQTAAHSAFGFTGAKTLSTLQSLYESKAVSYPRTGCEYISSQVDIGSIAKRILGSVSVDTSLLTREPGEVIADKTYVNDKAIASEGHTAIIPTGSRLSGSASADEAKLYELICRRFLAMFGTPKEYMSVKITSNPSGTKDPYVFTENYDIAPGYEFILNPGYKAKEGCGIEFKDGETLKPIEFFAKEITSQKPSRYNDGSLIAALDSPEKYEGEDGKKVAYKIGTPATRASIIEECQKNGYFYKEKSAFVATDKAIAIYEAYKDVPLFMPTESGRWEEMLEKVRNGEENMDDTYGVLMTKMKESVTLLKSGELREYERPEGGKGGGRKKGASHSVSCKCPVCQGEIKSGQYGLYCASKCGMSFGKVFGKELTEKEWEKVLSGEKILLKGLNFGSSGKPYNAYVKMKGIKDFSYVSKKTGKEVSGKQVDFGFDGYEK